VVHAEGAAGVGVGGGERLTCRVEDLPRRFVERDVDVDVRGIAGPVPGGTEVRGDGGEHVGRVGACRPACNAAGVRWTVHGERSLYESEWMQLRLADVELPDGRRFEHHLMRTPHQAAGALVHDPARGVLLLWRHRFITDQGSGALPAGRVDEGERPVDAAAREAEEETGWRPGPMRPLCRFAVAPGITDHEIAVFVAEGATQVGEPVDAYEAERVEWVPVEDVRRMLTDGSIVDGPCLLVLSYALATGVVG
jgi:8-oxo-dGTP pyrophosphatase MutT (NUDIX family)